jgi:hypothetical protein
MEQFHLPRERMVAVIDFVARSLNIRPVKSLAFLVLDYAGTDPQVG